MKFMKQNLVDRIHLAGQTREIFFLFGRLEKGETTVKIF